MGLPANFDIGTLYAPAKTGVERLRPQNHPVTNFSELSERDARMILFGIERSETFRTGLLAASMRHSIREMAR
jgi:hypothetical protein